MIYLRSVQKGENEHAYFFLKKLSSTFMYLSVWESNPAFARPLLHDRRVY
jgi:hypothetical protein